MVTGAVGWLLGAGALEAPLVEVLTGAGELAGALLGAEPDPLVEVETGTAAGADPVDDAPVVGAPL